MAVDVETHYAFGRRKRVQPLITVQDLIAGMKLTLPSTLGSVDINRLSLHTTENGTVCETSLERNKKLSSIPLTTGRTEENPAPSEEELPEMMVYHKKISSLSTSLKNLMINLELEPPDIKLAV